MQPCTETPAVTDTEKNEQYIRLLCSICAEVCHRGVRLSCCNIQACRGCATKEITRSRKCWRCEATHSTKSLVNDEHLRIKVQEYKKMAPSETRGRNNVRKSAVDLRPEVNGARSATNPVQRSKSKSKLSSTQSAIQLSKLSSAQSTCQLSKLSSAQSACQLPRKADPKPRARSKSSTRINTASEDISNGYMNGDMETTPVTTQSRNSPPRQKSQSRNNSPPPRRNSQSRNNNSPPRRNSQSRNSSPVRRLSVSRNSSPVRRMSASRNSPAGSRSQSRTRLKRSDSVSSEGGAAAATGRTCGETATTEINDENVAPGGGGGAGRPALNTTETPKTLSRFSGRSRLKKLIDCPPTSSCQRLSSLDVITLENTQKNSETEMVHTPSTVLPLAAPSTSNGYLVTPRTAGNKIKGNRRVCWSAVNIYYFQRSQGFCSVPREGGNTLGMESRHNSSSILSIQDPMEESDLHVKRKLFSASMEDQSPAVTQQLSTVNLQAVAAEMSSKVPAVASSAGLHEVHSCPANMEANFKISVDAEDEEISFKKMNFPIPQIASDDGEIVFKVGESSTESPPSVYHTPPEAYHTPPEVPPPATTTNPIPNTNPTGSTNLITKLVPEKPSSPFKRSLSRSYSDDRLSISPNTTRRKSINQDPPRKAHKPCNRIVNGENTNQVDEPPSASQEVQNSNQTLVPDAGPDIPELSSSLEAGTEASSYSSSSSGYRSEDSVSGNPDPAAQDTVESILGAATAAADGSDVSNSRLTAVRSAAAAAVTTTPEKSCTAMIVSPAAKASPILVSKSRPKLGRIAKSATKADLLLKRSTIKSVHDRGLIRLTRSTADLKQETVDIPGSSKLFEKADKKLVKSMSKSCLRSFREYHTSPEMQNPQLGEEDHCAQSPVSSLAREKNQEDAEQKRFKMGECGTRGLTPLSNRARVCLLRGNGVNALDKTEAEEAKVIRESREKCGCSCKGVCVAETCSCIQNEIECQVERPGFPCACTHKVCGNPNGRRFYDRTEIQLHFIQSMMNQSGVLNISNSQEV